MSNAELPPEIDYQLEHLLMDWWRYERAYRGWPRGAKASTIYGGVGNVFDTAGEVLEESNNSVKFDAVTGAIASLDRDHREAIDIKMMCYCTQAVWRSNRLGDRTEQLYVDAKAQLIPLLRRRRVDI